MKASHFSQLLKAISSIPAKVGADPKNISSWLIANCAKFSIKDDELYWSGILDWLDIQGDRKILASEITGYLEGNGIVIKEVLLGSPNLRVLELINQRQGLVNNLIRAAGSNGADELIIGKALGKLAESNELTDAEWEYVNKYLPPEIVNDGNDINQIYDINGRINYLNATIPFEDRARYESESISGGINYREMIVALGKMPEKMSKGFKSSHWDWIDNPLVHIRFDERTNSKNQKIMFIQEIQSDWGERGRASGFQEVYEPLLALPNNFRVEHVRRNSKLWAVRDSNEYEWTPGGKFNKEAAIQWALDDLNAKRAREFKSAPKRDIPIAPFVGSTKSWVELAIKRIVAYAADNMFEKVAFINGDQVSARYGNVDKSESIEFDARTNTLKKFTANNYVISELHLSNGFDDLHKHLDKRSLETLRAKFNDQSGLYRVDGLYLNKSANGFNTLYDVIIPSAAKKVFKTLDSDSEGEHLMSADINIHDESNPNSQLAFEITQKMRESLVVNGLPMFKVTGPDIKPSSPATGGLDIWTAIKAIKEINRNWKIKIQITPVKTHTDFSAQQLFDIKKANAKAQNVVALLSKRSGEVTVNLSKIRDVEELEKVIFHEVFIHVGFGRIFGNQLTSKMNEIYHALGAEIGIDRVAKSKGIDLSPYKKFYPGASKFYRESIIAEELISHIAEQSQNTGLAQALKESYGKMKNKLRQWGFSKLAKYSSADIPFLIKSARDSIVNNCSFKLSEYIISGDGKKRAVTLDFESPTMFKYERERHLDIPDTIMMHGKCLPTKNSRGEYISSTIDGIINFWNWFDDSKCVDDLGRPLVVNHGTASDFSVFNESHIGENFGDKSGFYFTNNTMHRETGKKTYEGFSDIHEDHTGAGAYSNNAALNKTHNSSLNGSFVMPAYIKLSRPLIVRADTDGAGVLSLIETSGVSAGSTVCEAIEEGYDGLIIIDEGHDVHTSGNPNSSGDGWQKETIVIATAKHQIKSALGNTGNFNNDSDDIRFSVDGEKLEHTEDISFANFEVLELSQLLGVNLNQSKSLLNIAAELDLEELYSINSDTLESEIFATFQSDEVKYYFLISGGGKQQWITNQDLISEIKCNAENSGVLKYSAEKPYQKQCTLNMSH